MFGKITFLASGLIRKCAKNVLITHVARENVRFSKMKKILSVCGLKARQAMNKYAIYECIKAEIAQTAKSQEEYERRIKALARKLKI
ncbi:MAG: hypothetical protein KIG40_02095 [Bacteroidaceae bacterium]|nr:hypothetical protein [Bacteroidaceae bacterium]